MPASVVIYDRGLAKLARGLNNPRAFSPVKKLIGAIYRSFAMQRFSRLSRGGGEWPPLKKSTIARRRKGKGGGRSASILIDTGLLFATLAPTPNGAWVEEDTSSGFRFGYGGPTKHGDGKVTIADIASFHQEGAGKLPVRKVIAEPDKATLELMTRRINEWLQKQIQ